MKNYFKFKHLCMYVCMLLITYSCTKEDSKIDESMSAKSRMIAPSGLITPERMVELSSNWSNTRAKPIENALGIEDNRSVKFTLEDLRNYLDYAEYEARTLGYEMDGVRIYFAAYGNNEPKGKAGYATAFFAPTGTKTKISEASMFNLLFLQDDGGDGDINGGSGLNNGGHGNPPGVDYPQ